MKRSFTMALMLLLSVVAKTQSVAINTDGSSPDTSAILDVSSSTKGVLIPRMTTIQRNAIVTPAAGLLIYQTNNVKGFYYNNGVGWVPLVDSKNNLWLTNTSNNIYNTTAKVGIGNNAPRMQLHVTTTTGLAMVMENPVNLATNLTTGMYFKSANEYYGAIKAIGTGSDYGRLGLFTYAGADSSALLERVSITDDGLVGIGTTTPTATLEVNGSAKIDGTVYMSTNAQVTGNATMGSATVSGNATVSGTASVAGALTNNGLGVMVGSNGTQLKVVTYTATLSVTNLAANTLLGATGSLSISGFSGTPTAYIGNIITGSENGDYYRAVIIPDNVTSTNVRLKIFNPTATPITFSNVQWKVLVIGPK